jgi:hypothetical protein
MEALSSVADLGCLSRIRIFSPSRIPNPTKKKQVKNKLVVLPVLIDYYFNFLRRYKKRFESIDTEYRI